MTSDPERKLGLYGKFIVRRSDGTSEVGQKHFNCFYFVLDCEHDKHAKAALKAYIKSCAKEFPALAKDLRALFKRPVQCGCRSAGHELGCLNLGPMPPRFGR